MYGPDAAKVFAVVKPVLRQESITSGASVELRLTDLDTPLTFQKVAL